MKNLDKKYNSNLTHTFTEHHETPLLEAHFQYVNSSGTIPFDVPGHKRGVGNIYLQEYFGKRAARLDINSLPELDQLSHPTGVIKHAQHLMADAYGADAAFFMVNGTTSSVHAMILSACRPGDKIILPRNVHKSAINALIFADAYPIYMNCSIQEELEIATTVTFETAKQTIDENLDAKAILLLNPSYWGLCCDLKKITEYAHAHNMLVLVDEAHGAHFTFHDELPPSAMEVGADMAAASLHKTGGSFTQSSVLLINEKRVDTSYVAMIINMIQTTSASYLLMSSLDAARKNLVLHGKEKLTELLQHVRELKENINKIPGLYAYGTELIGQDGITYVDETKLVVHVKNLGLTGFEVYEIFRLKYGIQLELGDTSNVLAIVSLGDDERSLQMLLEAFQDVAKTCYQKVKAMSKTIIPTMIPQVVKRPREAFYAEKEEVSLEEAIGRISGESIMAYPPGIPIVTPGEYITKESIEYLEFLKKNHANITDAKDMNVEKMTVLKQGVW